eukprot:6491165-Amphidinium_carterae.1
MWLDGRSRWLSNPIRLTLADTRDPVQTFLQGQWRGEPGPPPPPPRVCKDFRHWRRRSVTECHSYTAIERAFCNEEFVGDLKGGWCALVVLSLSNDVVGGALCSCGSSRGLVKSANHRFLLRLFDPSKENANSWREEERERDFLKFCSVCPNVLGILSQKEGTVKEGSSLPLSLLSDCSSLSLSRTVVGLFSAVFPFEVSNFREVPSLCSVPLIETLRQHRTRTQMGNTCPPPNPPNHIPPKERKGQLQLSLILVHLRSYSLVCDTTHTGPEVFDYFLLFGTTNWSLLYCDYGFLEVGTVHKEIGSTVRGNGGNAVAFGHRRADCIRTKFIFGKAEQETTRNSVEQRCAKRPPEPFRAPAPPLSCAYSALWLSADSVLINEWGFCGGCIVL